MGAEDAVPIKTSKIVVRDWILLKCRFSCGTYGRRSTCPPYSPTPEETRRVLKEYETALLVKFGPSIEAGCSDGVNIHKVIFELERLILLSGYYAASGMACGPCPLCAECNMREGPCLKPHVPRPSMEACSIDIFAVAYNADLELKVLKSQEELPHCFGLVLINLELP